MGKERVEDGLEEKAGFRIGAFFFSFVYYFYWGLWVWGIVGFILVTVLPFQVYFGVSFIESLLLFRENRRGKCIGTKVGTWGIVVGCVSVLVCVVCKYWLYRLIEMIIM